MLQVADPRLDFPHVIAHGINGTANMAQMLQDQPLTDVGTDSAGKTWDNVIDKSPQPVASSTDVTSALLNECTG